MRSTPIMNQGNTVTKTMKKKENQNGRWRRARKTIQIPTRGKRPD